MYEVYAVYNGIRVRGTTFHSAGLQFAVAALEQHLQECSVPYTTLFVVRNDRHGQEIKGTKRAL